jgi:hypothetical protein
MDSVLEFPDVKVRRVAVPASEMSRRMGREACWITLWYAMTEPEFYRAGGSRRF